RTWTAPAVAGRRENCASTAPASEAARPASTNHACRRAVLRRLCAPPADRKDLACESVTRTQDRPPSRVDRALTSNRPGPQSRPWAGAALRVARCPALPREIFAWLWV